MNQRTPSSHSYQLESFASMARQWAASYLGLVLLGTLVVGLLIGWFLFGWVIAPVVYVDAKPSRLSTQYQEVLLSYAADSYISGYTPIEEVAKRLGEGWTKAQVIGRIDHMLATGWPGADRLFALKIGLTSFEGEIGPVPVSDSSGLIGLVLVVLAASVAVGVLIVSRIRSEQPRPAAGVRASPMSSTPPPAADNAQPSSPPAEREAGGVQPVDKPAWAGKGRKPLVQYPTTYELGDDRYDMSFSIDTSSGDFLGECGVGIGEIVGSGTPDKVTALEVWLFDKNDIRTLTKVLMSDFCFGDSALKAKLAPKGEAVQIKQGDSIELKTQALRVTARIVDLIYGEANAKDNIAANSYFQKVEIELAAWNL
jgi:hypothetical protein